MLVWYVSPSLSSQQESKSFLLAFRCSLFSLKLFVSDFCFLFRLAESLNSAYFNVALPGDRPASLCTYFKKKEQFLNNIEQFLNNV